MHCTSRLPSTEGYTEHAAWLIQYEAMVFEEHHRTELHLLTTTPGHMLDIGAGTGVDAAWFAAQGHSVVSGLEDVRSKNEALYRRLLLSTLPQFGRFPSIPSSVLAKRQVNGRHSTS